MRNGVPASRRRLVSAGGEQREARGLVEQLRCSLVEQSLGAVGRELASEDIHRNAEEREAEDDRRQAHQRVRDNEAVADLPEQAVRDPAVEQDDEQRREDEDAQNDGADEDELGRVREAADQDHHENDDEEDEADAADTALALIPGAEAGAELGRRWTHAGRKPLG